MIPWWVGVAWALVAIIITRYWVRAAEPPRTPSWQVDSSRYELAYVGLGLPVYCRDCNERLPTERHIVGKPGVIPFGAVVHEIRTHEREHHRGR